LNRAACSILLDSKVTSFGYAQDRRMALDNYFRDDDFWAALCVTMSAARGNDKITVFLMTS